jgi:ElaB/YqjD/DUF883 family membrane-anchored ribosome-binding protein
MAESTEVIQHEIAETRTDLAEKLAELSDKITGTVEAVEETVASVSEKATETVEAVKETVSSVTERASETVEAVKETVEGTVEAVKDSVSGTVQAVRNAFDLSKQTEEHPWLVFGGSVAVGFAGGMLLGNLLSRSSRAYPEKTSWEPHHETPSNYRKEPEREFARPQETTHREAMPEAGPAQPSWFSNAAGSVLEKIAPQLNNLKSLALGALFGVIRDVATHNLPGSLKEDVANVINNVTESLGGKKIEGPILGDEESDSAEQEESEERPAHGQFRTGTEFQQSGQRPQW